MSIVYRNIDFGTKVFKYSMFPLFWLLDSVQLFSINTFMGREGHQRQLTPLADPGGGGAPGARPPPNGRGPMIFFSLRSRIILKPYFNRNVAKSWIRH